MKTTKLRDGGIAIRAMSAIVFLVFTFLWLFYFQADVLAYAQHVASGGQTHYNRLVGTVLITVVLWLLQLGVYALVRLRTHCHALTYFPSFVVLALLGAVCPSAAAPSSLSLWWLLLVPLVALWLFAVWAVRVVSKFEHKQQPTFFSRSMWVNLLILAVMIVGVTIVTDTNAVFHHRARVETCLMEQRFDDALQVGRKSLETDASLTMLRAYALSRQGLLGERLFEYPVAGRGADLVPLDSSQSRLLRYPQDSIFRHLGAIPRPGMTTPVYLDRLLRHNQASPAVRDYVLCGLLIDRDLDAFVKALPAYYEVSDTLTRKGEPHALPRHYREALVLYTHLRSLPVLVYHDAVTEEDYANLQELEAQFSNPRERHIRVKEEYQGSYWYYYEYMKE